MKKHGHFVTRPELEPILIKAFNKLPFVEKVHCSRYRDTDKGDVMSVTVLFTEDPFEAGFQIGMAVAAAAIELKFNKVKKKDNTETN